MIMLYWGNYIRVHTHGHRFAFCVQPGLIGRIRYNKWQSMFIYLTVQPRLNEKLKPLPRTCINFNSTLQVQIDCVSEVVVRPERAAST